MANVDVTLKLTNPKLYNDLMNLVSGKSHIVNIEVKPDMSNVKNLKQDISKAIGVVDVEINPKLGKVADLRQQIQNAIGNISINVSIGNLAALNNQIQQLFAGLGINASNVPPSSGGGNRRGRRINTRALLNELSRDIEQGVPNAVQRGFVRQSDLTRSETVQRGRQRGTDYNAILSRSAVARLDNAPSKNLMKQISIYKSRLGRGDVDPNLSAFLNQVQTMAGNLPARSIAAQQLMSAHDDLSQKLIKAYAPALPPKVAARARNPHQSLLDRTRLYNQQLGTGFLDLGYGQHLQDLDAAMQGTTDPFMRDQLAQARRGLEYKNMTSGVRGEESAKKRSLRSNALQRKFEQRNLFDIAMLGPDRAAREFEADEGIETPSIRTKGMKRLSFDLSRAYNTKEARNELGFASLFGGVTGAVGGLVGGGFFGQGGVFLGSAILQKAVGVVQDSFQQIAEGLMKASAAGLEFERNVIGIASVLSTTSRVVNPDGSTASLTDSVKFQRGRASALLGATRKELAPLGINQTQQAAILRGVLSGGSEGGFNFTDKQAVKVSKLIGGVTSATNEDLLQQTPRLVNDISDLLAGAPTAGRSELGQQFRRIIPEIKAAQAAGDTERLIKALEKYKGVIDVLTLSTDSASVAFRKYDSISQQLQTTFGEAFNKAIVPGLNHLNKVLSNPANEKSLESLATSLGELTSVLIDFSALNLTGIANFFKDIMFVAQAIDPKSMVKALAGSLPGPVGPLLEFVLDGSRGGGGNFSTKNNASSIDTVISKMLQEEKDPSSRQAGYVKELTSIYGDKGTTDAQKEVLAKGLFAKQKYENALTGIDQGSPAGAFQAQMLGLDEQLRLGSINQDVYNSQRNRLSGQFGIQQQLAGINSNRNIRTRLDANLLGISQNELSRSVTSGVAGEQKTLAIFDAQKQLVTSFYELQKAVNDSTLAFEMNKNKNDELNLTLDQLKTAQKNLADDQKLQTLQGADRVLALADRVRSSGGSVDIGLLNKISGAGLDGFSEFGALSTPEERQRKILERQFKQEANNLLGLPTQQKLDRLNLEDRIAQTKGEINNLPINKQLSEVAMNRDIAAFAQEFGLGEAQKVFNKGGNDRVQEALDFFGAKAKEVGMNNNVAEELRRIFNDSYYEKIGKAVGQNVASALMN